MVNESREACGSYWSAAAPIAVFPLTRVALAGIALILGFASREKALQFLGQVIRMIWLGQCVGIFFAQFAALLRDERRARGENDLDAGKFLTHGLRQGKTVDRAPQLDLGKQSINLGAGAQNLQRLVRAQR